MKTFQLPIDKIIIQLGYKSSGNFFMSNQFQNAPLSPQYKRILKEINPYAAYIVDNAPFVLFFDKVVNDDISFKKISKQVWNAQIPVAIFCDESTVKIFNGLSLDVSNYILKQIEAYSTEDCNENSDFSYWQISNPVFWNNYNQIYSGTKLNQSLLDNISFVTNELKNTYHIQFATKLVLRLIFIRYLIDRGVDLDYGNFSTDITQSQKEFLKLVSSKNDIYELFAHLKEKFNGNLFELEDEIYCTKLTTEVFVLLSDFFSGKEVLNTKQLSLFALYDFNIIPVELISNIYEILLGKETRDKDNAFYTPNYLVEYILDRTVMKTLKEKSSFTILDPSCGSGVFLVDSYRRIIQENLGKKLYCDDDAVLKRLLTNHIYGIDINEEAIDVTIFSLYLTILDYKDPKTLSEFILPNLKGENLFVSDFFDEEKLKSLTEKNIAFDYIIGNPPWGNVKTGLHMSYCKSKGFADKQQNNEISRSFVFRAKDFCTVNTTCCFILHSKLLYNQKNPAVKFRKFMLKETEICDIVELSSVRKLVFENADAPAAIVAFKYNYKNNLNHNFTYTSVKPNIFFRLFHVICVEKNDIKSIPQALLFTYDWAWKTIVYGSSYDLETIVKLKNKYRTIEQILDEQTPPIVKGAGVEYQDGDKNDATHLLGRKLLDSQNGVEHFIVNSSCTSVFSKSQIHRPRDKRLFEPPYVLIPKGIDCTNYKLKAAYSEESFVSKTTMYIIKGTKIQKSFLLNLVGLLNSSMYAYLNLMLGTSIGIEREQRFMDEILSYPYLFSEKVVDKVDHIQTMLNNQKQYALCDYDKDNNENQLDNMILKEFGLESNNFVDYAINIQIPELTNSNKSQAYRTVSVDDLKKYSECFIKQFSLIYNPSNKYVSVTLYPNIGNYYAVFELHINDSKPVTEILIANEADDEKKLFTQFSVYEHNDKFYQIRDVIHFSTNSLFIIKPNFYKNWHPAIAEIDLADVIDQIMSTSGGDE